MSTSAPTNYELAHTYGGVPFARRLPIPLTILAYLAARARTQRDAPFVTTVAGDGPTAMMSYGELYARSGRVAAWLRCELGVRAGDRLGLVTANDADSIVACLGALRAGSAVLMLNPADPPGRHRAQSAALGTRAVLHGSNVLVDDVPGACSVEKAAAFSDEDDGFDPACIDPAADALFFGTSGSTAASKLVAQSHYSAAMNAHALRHHHRLRRGDRILGCLPIHHVNGLHFTVLATLAAGAHLILAHAFHPLTYPRIVERFRPRIASVVPSILEALLDTWRRPTMPDGFEYFVSAAAPLSSMTARAVARQLHTRVLQGYGLTETTNFSTTMPVGLSEETAARLTHDTDIPSIGVALLGNEVAVLTPDGLPARPGEVGEICIRGHNVMTRYHDNPVATAEAFRGGWFHSQDLGSEIPHAESGQRFFVITGRTKNVAKVRGEAVSLEEMERMLCALPNVRDAACIAFPHRLLGEAIVAAVVFADGADETDPRDALRTMFAPSVLPQRIVRAEAIPRTPTGKILRPQLAQLLAPLA